MIKLSSEKIKPQINKMFKISYSIHTKEAPIEIIKMLKAKKIPFEVWKNKELKEEYYDIDEELPLIEVDLEIYQKLKKISEITGISIKDMASNEFSHFLTDFIPEEPFIFLDIFLGIENVKDPIAIIEKLKDIVNFSSKYVEYLKTIDPVKYVEEWNTGHIKPNK